MEPFKVAIIKAEYAENVFGGHFPTEHKVVTDYILRHDFYLVYLNSCVGLDLFFCIFFIVINHITSLKQAHLFFVNFSEYLLLFLDDKVAENTNNFQITKVQPEGFC